MTVTGAGKSAVNFQLIIRNFGGQVDFGKAGFSDVTSPN